MARELKITDTTTADPIELVAKSNTGREIVMGFDTLGGTNWAGASVELQTQLEVGGELSRIATFPVAGAIHTEDFAVEISVGFKNPLFISVTNPPAAGNDIFVKVVTAEAV